MGSAARPPAALCTYWESGPLSFGNAPRTANAHTEPSSSSVGNSSGGVSEASFDEARRRFRLGILMLVLPGRLAQHDKDIGRARRGWRAQACRTNCTNYLHLRDSYLVPSSSAYQHGEATTCVPSVAHGLGVTKWPCGASSAHTYHIPDVPLFWPDSPALARIFESS